MTLILFFLILSFISDVMVILTYNNIKFKREHKHFRLFGLDRQAMQIIFITDHLRYLIPLVAQTLLYLCAVRSCQENPTILQAATLGFIFQKGRMSLI